VYCKVLLPPEPNMDHFVTGRADEHAAAIELHSGPTHTFKHAFSHANLLSIVSLHFLVTLVQTLVCFLVQALVYVVVHISLHISQFQSVVCVLVGKELHISILELSTATTLGDNTSSWRITWGFSGTPPHRHADPVLIRKVKKKFRPGRPPPHPLFGNPVPPPPWLYVGCMWGMWMLYVCCKCAIHA
jgi:hypothetical protein